jgi:hypothetical protein
VEPLFEGGVFAGEFDYFLGNDAAEESRHRADGAVSKPDHFARNICVKFIDVHVALGLRTFVQGFASIHYLLHLCLVLGGFVASEKALNGDVQLL